MTSVLTAKETTRLHRWAMWRMTVNEGIISCIRDSSTSRVIYPDSTSDSSSLTNSEAPDLHEFPFITLEQINLARKLNLREKYGSNHGLSDDAYFIFGLPRISIGKDIPEVTSTGTRSIYESFSELGDIGNRLSSRGFSADNGGGLNGTSSELGPTPDAQSLASHSNDVEVQRINGYREEGWKGQPPPVPGLNLYSIQEEFNNNTGQMTSHYFSHNDPESQRNNLRYSSNCSEEETDSPYLFQRCQESTNRYPSRSYPDKETGNQHLSRRYPDEETGNRHLSNSYPEEETGNRHLSRSYSEEQTGNRHLSRSYPEEQTGNRHLSRSYSEEQTGKRHLLNRHQEEETSHRLSSRYQGGQKTECYPSSGFPDHQNRLPDEDVPTYSVKEVINRYESVNRYTSESSDPVYSRRKVSSSSSDRFNRNSRSAPQSPVHDIYPPFSPARQSSHSPTRRSYSPLPSSPRQNYSTLPTYSKQSHAPSFSAQKSNFPSGEGRVGQAVLSPGYGNKMRPTRLLSDGESEKLKRQAYYDWSTPTKERYKMEFTSPTRFMS